MKGRMRNWKSTVMMLTISVLPAERSLIPIVVCSFISDRPSECCQPSEQDITAVEVANVVVACCNGKEEKIG